MFFFFKLYEWFELIQEYSQEKNTEQFKHGCKQDRQKKRGAEEEKKRSQYQAGLNWDLISTSWLAPMTRLPLASCLRPAAVITAFSSSPLVTLCPSDGCLRCSFLHSSLCLPRSAYLRVCACIYVNQPKSLSGGCSVRKGYQNTTVHWEL